MSLIVVRTGLLPDHPPLQVQIAHQARDAAPGNIKAFPLHLPPDLAHTIDAEVLGKDPHDFRLEVLITLRSGRSPARIAALGNAFVVA